MSNWVPMHTVLDEGSSGNARIEHFDVNKHASEMTSFRRGEYVREGRYTRLIVDNVVMMSDTHMEKNSNWSIVHNAKGHVLIAGLGLGMITLPILAKPEVETVTVVEMNPHVIRLVEPCLRKRPESAKLTIVEADIFAWEPPKSMKWDTIYFDIWPFICTDNLAEMTRLHKKFARRKTSKSAFMDSWMRQTLQSQNRADKREEAKWGRFW